MNIPYPIAINISDRERQIQEDYLCDLPNGVILTINRGFIYDGASIPRLFWSLIGSPFTGTHQRAALIHDALYAAELYSRETCDWIFLQIMQYHGCNWLKRNLMWSAVKIFGRSVWKSHKKEEVEKARKLVKLIS